MSSGLVVPLIIWGRQAPTHCISSVLMTSDQLHIVTGCNDGQLCLWDITNTESWQIHPQTMLFGHSAAVTCLAMASANSNDSYIVSSADNGEMCVWDLNDGRCVESTRMPIVHTSIQAYQLMQCHDTRLICNGYYPEIHIVHPRRLEILFSLCAQIQPDWISALCVLRPVSREDDVIVAVSSSGLVKVWTIQGSSDPKLGSQQIYEDESKQIRCLNAQTLRCCAYNQRTVLIVCSKYWQIYDAGDFSLLCSESSRCGERWTGGEFLAIDRIVVWSNEGRGYLYKLPTNLLRGKAVQSVNPESEHYRKPADPSSPKQMGPLAYGVLDVYSNKILECTPVMTYVLGRRERELKLLLRGDCEGRLAVWNIPDVNESKMKLARQESFENLPVQRPVCATTLQEEWSKVNPAAEGLIDRLNCENGNNLQVTASVFMPSQGKLACGRDDGSIILIPAVHTIVRHLLECAGQDKDEIPSHQVLSGHCGRVTCLLYPHNESSRYDPSHLVSGGVDFSVYLWDINACTRLHKFCVHGGEIVQLLVPPEACSSRVQASVCALASDHSLSLLSLRENKCILLASRHLFPIQTVKWRPNDDFIVIGCTDGTVYVWQMETGHLDRVVHGITAEEILDACDEKMDASAGERLSNPTISIAQAVRRHNLATFRHMANQQIKRAQEALDPKMTRTMHPSLVQRVQSAEPFMVQGLRANTRDPDSHVVYFDIEALIVQLLSEEYAALSPDTLEALGFYTSVAKDLGLSDAQKKVFDLLSKFKEKAENVGQSLQARVDNAGIKVPSPRVARRSVDTSAGESSAPGAGGGGSASGSRRPSSTSSQLSSSSRKPLSTSASLTAAQIIMSCLHTWGIDTDLDQLCINKLGLLRPRRPISFGFLSRAGGQMSLSLPGWYRHFSAASKTTTTSSSAAIVTVGHWQLSNAVTTQHLLAIISVANTLMSMSNATFVMALRSVEPHAILMSDTDANNQSQTKQGWSLLAALHCVMLPDLIGIDRYRSPMLEMLARRWQDRCLEIREAAQALLLAELRRVGVGGRRQIVDEWSPYLPSNVDPALSLLSEANTQATALAQASAGGNAPADALDLDDDDNEDNIFITGEAINGSNKMSAAHESRRKQATAIVMMGVIGAEFGASLEGAASSNSDKTGVAEGFGLANYTHARHTSKALTFLLLQPPSSTLPAHSLLRRAAVDLLGRGFAVWEPYLDISTVLLGLLELCVDGDSLVPNMTCGLPLSARADACRTARHSLALIATARPPAFIITMAKEVARYNALAQNAQAQHHHHQLQNSVLVRGRPEILHIIELLVEKIPNDVAELLVEVMDVTVHCLDQVVVKNKGLQEAFPAICRFCMVSYCSHTRRICVGAKNGSIAFYDLKQNKCQILPAHSGGVNAVAFSPDGKILASYSYNDNRLLFWQTGSSSLFGIGAQHTKCVKTFSTPPVRLAANQNPLKMVRLVWIDGRTVALLVADGTETRYRV